MAAFRSRGRASMACAADVYFVRAQCLDQDCDNSSAHSCRAHPAQCSDGSGSGSSVCGHRFSSELDQLGKGRLCGGAKIAGVGAAALRLKIASRRTTSVNTRRPRRRMAYQEPFAPPIARPGQRFACLPAGCLRSFAPVVFSFSTFVLSASQNGQQARNRGDARGSLSQRMSASIA